MTNREYEKKQHRGSAPSRNDVPVQDTGTKTTTAEDWQNAIWYPASVAPADARSVIRDPIH